MAIITLKGNAVNTVGDLPKIGNEAPGFTLVKGDLSEVSLESFKGKSVVLNIFPSIDTPTCASSVRKFNQEASNAQNIVVLCISKDLPFAQNRFCGAEGLKDVITLSEFRNHDFGKNYGLEIVDGPLKGLLARAVVLIDPHGLVTYTELVPEIADEPDYGSVLEKIK